MMCRWHSEAASEPRLTEERSKGASKAALRCRDESQVLLPAPNKHRNYDTKAHRKSGACFLS